MTRLKTEQLESLIGCLNQKRREAVTFADVLALAEITAQSLHLFFETMDTAVYREMREIAGYIEKMRNEIGALQADDIKQSRIPAAGQELGAIVQATESATHTIMNAAEALMCADPADPAFKSLMQEKVIVIFEACSFQDITGQRIAKVIETLQHIETRVSRFASAVSARVDMSFGSEEYANDEERARAERKERLMLHGPQSGRDAINQADVDALIAGKGKSPQSAVDDIFK